MLRGLLRSALVLGVVFLPIPAVSSVSTAVPASGSAPALCRDAARAAAARHGIPVEMMQAITLVETRRKIGGITGPWPWTLNIDGKGYWYDTRSEALGHARREIAGGRLSVDLGCFQLNYRWHGGNFAALDEMLDPALAADYAARFLGELFAETGDWMRAAGHYHSRTPIHAQRYRGMIGRALAGLDGTQDAASAQSGPPVAAQPGPRPVKLARAEPAGAEPPHAFFLATARAASDPATAMTAISASPGAVVLRLFAGPARPLLAIVGTKP
jgi:hypothetical protein